MKYAIKLNAATMKIFLTLLLVAVAAQGEEKPQAKPAQDAAKQQAAAAPAPEKGRDAQLGELIEAVMTAKISKELGLNEEQTVLMVRRLSEFKSQLDVMKRQRQEKMKKLRDALHEKQPDEAIEVALQDLQTHDLETLKFRKSVYQKAADNLSVSQRARLYVFISDFENDMRRLVQKARESRENQRRKEEKPAAPATEASSKGR